MDVHLNLYKVRDLLSETMKTWGIVLILLMVLMVVYLATEGTARYFASLCCMGFIFMISFSGLMHIWQAISLLDEYTEKVENSDLEVDS